MLNIGINNNIVLMSANYDFNMRSLDFEFGDFKVQEDDMTSFFGAKQIKTGDSNTTNIRMFLPKATDRDGNVGDDAYQFAKVTQFNNFLKHILSLYYSDEKIGSTFAEIMQPYFEEEFEGFNMESLKKCLGNAKSFDKYCDMLVKAFLKLINDKELNKEAFPFRIKTYNSYTKTNGYKSYPQFPNSGYNNDYDLEEGTGVIESMDVPQEASQLRYSLYEKGLKAVKNSATNDFEKDADGNLKTEIRYDKNGNPVPNRSVHPDKITTEQGGGKLVEGSKEQQQQKKDLSDVLG